jgi:hypothetical protein
MPDPPNAATVDATVDFLYDVMKDGADRAMAQIKSLEGRGGQAFGAGTILIGLASLGNLPKGTPTIAFALFLVGAAAYAVAALNALRLLSPTSVGGLPSFADMWSNLRSHALSEVKASLAQTMVGAEPDNDSAIDTRVRRARWVVAAVGVEGVAIGLGLLATHWPF